MAKTFNPTTIAHLIRKSQDITFEDLAKEYEMSVERFCQQLKARLGVSEYNKLAKRERQNHSKSTTIIPHHSAQSIRLELERRTNLRNELVVAYNNATTVANELFATISRLRDKLNEAQADYMKAQGKLRDLQGQTKLNEEKIAHLELQLADLTKYICFADYDGPVKASYIKAGTPREQLYQVASIDPKVFTDVSFASVIQAVNDVNFALIYIQEHPDKVVEVLCGPITSIIWESATK